MNEAAALLVGEHDFAAFCRRREGATTVRALRRLDWRRDADGVAVACVVADAFCHNMVRALVGSLLPVGDASRPPSWPASVLAAAVRDPAVRVVPPHGLCLEEVRYPPPGELAARATQTRQLREMADTHPTDVPGFLLAARMDWASEASCRGVRGVVPPGKHQRGSRSC